MRIAIVNDMVMAVECLRRAVVASGGHDIAWIAGDGQEAVALCAQDRPDLILMDLFMPVMDGVAATERIMRDTPCAILVVTADVAQHADQVFRALGAGALDAVNTPLCAGTADAPSASLFLEKLATLESWTRPCPVAALPGSADAKVARSATSNAPLIVIGASSGGPNALAELLAELPPDLGVGIVIVQHLDARFVPELVDWLRQKTPLPVSIVQPNQRPAHGEVWIACTDDHLTMGPGGFLSYSVEPCGSIYKPSIDVFFEAVAEYWQGPVAGIVLSGMGRDGAVGLGTLKRAGHTTSAQDRESCAVYGMPRAAAELRVVDMIANPIGLAYEVARWCERVAPKTLRSAEMAADSAGDFAATAAGEGDNVARVLLVDDQVIIHEAFRRMMDGVEDVTLHYCSEPVRALSEAKNFKPTVILQDLVMPGMNGLMLLGQLRGDAATRSVPIIVLSTNEDPKIKSEAFAIGASDYLVKFPDRIELLARIRAHSRSFLAQQQRDEAYRELRLLKVELERKNAELESLSCRDGLTGVLNRRAFDEYLNKEWLRSLRERTDLGLLLIDIDHFKDYNDNYGHQEGDECLRRVAFALGGGLKRPSDVVARYGGEEFAVILPDTKVEGGERIGEELRAGIERLHLNHAFSSSADFVSISVGVASIQPMPGKSPADLVRAADKALYEAKARGRNRCCAYSDAQATAGNGRSG